MRPSSFPVGYWERRSNFPSEIWTKATHDPVDGPTNAHIASTKETQYLSNKKREIKR